jgi:hypothetical protein
MKTIFVVSVIAMPLLASAQSPALATSAKAKPLAYESSFANYRSFKDEPVGVWRDINDAAKKAGGWRVYARELSQSQSSSGTASGGEGKGTVSQGGAAK